MNTPIRYTPVLEHIDEDEPETVAAISETLLKIAKITYEDGHHGLRAVHAKSHALVHGQLQIAADLPPELAQGLFAQAGQYPVILRFSTSPGDVLDDKVSTPRGLAIKVLNVPGARLPGSEGASTQDFLMINGKAFLQPDAKGFNRSLKLLAATTDRAEGAKKILSAVLRGAERLVEAVGGESGTLKGLGGEPLHQPLGESYFTAVPLLYGDYMAKLSLAPASAALRALTGAPVDLKDKPDGLRAAANDFFAEQGGDWELRVQLCTDVETMPIEDASVVWPEDESPYRVVARLHVPAQPAWSAGATPSSEDSLFFSPWHGLAAHRPLGSVNRVRQAAYEASGRARAARNGLPFAEPGATGGCPFPHR